MYSNIQKRSFSPASLDSTRKAHTETSTMDKAAKKVRTESSSDSGILEECKKEVRMIC
jgi:hypothetical protein